MRRKDPAASARARLLNLARRQGQDYQRVLVRFANERLLYRLSRSEYSERFVLKGATLFSLWMGQPHRATRDLDLLGSGRPDVDEYVVLFQDVARFDAPEDGLVFEAGNISGTFIREDARYMGIRLTMQASLAGARITMQVDIGTGDAVVPRPETAELPTLLDHPAPRLKVYSREAVIAEKFEAMVTLGIANSRMKDFYDLWFLAHTFAFDGDVLSGAVEATFRRRGTALPVTLPIALHDDFSEDESKLVQWRAFVRKSDIDRGTPSLPTVISSVRSIAWPIVEALNTKKSPPENWPPGGPWKARSSRSG
jgi:predicted nucleotidyltransferase component of viral defense system